MITSERLSEIRELASLPSNGSIYFDHVPELLAHIDYLERELASRREQDRWIPVGERLPIDGEDVLIYTEVEGMLVGSFDTEMNYWRDATCFDLQVTKWRPLPSPDQDEGRG